MTHASSLLAPALDPIFAVIAEHRAAWEASNRASLASGRISGDAPEYDAALELARAAADRAWPLLTDVLTAQPTTLAGAVALLAHVGQTESGEREGEFWQTYLSIASDCNVDETRDAAKNFPLRLAETLRGLIGEAQP
jgi:hypothetical protein